MKSQNKPLVDVVISTGGRFDMLEKCWNALNKYTNIPISLTIIDDGSDKVKKLPYSYLFTGENRNPNIVTFTTKRNEVSRGFSEANNMGARKGEAPLILFMNDDTEITETFFDVLVKTMEDRSIGICGAKLLFPPYSTDAHRPAGRVQHIGLALDVGANAVHPLVGWSADNPRACKSRECMAVTGAMLTIRRELFRKCNGFDLIYGKGYWEDVDLCLKVRQLGYKIIVNTNLIAYHFTGASSSVSQDFSKDFRVNAMTFRSRWANSGMMVFDAWTYW